MFFPSMLRCVQCIPGRVIAGAYPASLDDVETERILTTLLELGVNTFVCLQAEVNINCPEHVWRSGQGLRPYIKVRRRRAIGSQAVHQGEEAQGNWAAASGRRGGFKQPARCY
eukprot:365702-Chlamydomonas_euryale.AAC.34